MSREMPLCSSASYSRSNASVGESACSVMLFVWSLRTRELQLHATDAPNTLVFMFYSVEFRELYSSRKLGFSVFWVLRNSRLGAHIAIRRELLLLLAFAR